jgi:hypothetical protein
MIDHQVPSKSSMNGNLRSIDSWCYGGINYIECVASILRRIAVGDSLLFGCNSTMETFADGICLRILKWWLELVQNHCKSGEFRSLIVNYLNISWIPSKPAIFETHCDLFASSVIGLYDLFKCGANVDYGQWFDDEISASGIDLP